MQSRTVLAGVIAAVGVVVAWRALQRPGATPPHPRVTEQASEELPVHDGVELARADDAGDAAFVLQAASSRVRAAAPAVVGAVGASRGDLDALAALVAGRLEVIIAPETRDWRELARSEGGAWSETLAQMPEQARARYEGWREWWRNAEFGADAAEIRHLRLDDLDAYSEQFGAMTAKNPLSAQYPIDDLARVIEVVIPVRVADRAGGAPRVEAHLGVAYWWSTAERRWRPAMITVYTNAEVVVPPPM